MNRMMASVPRLRRTLPATIAAVLACCYAGVLAVLAFILVVDWTTGRGTVGHLGSTAANRGVSFFVVLCIGGAAVLVAGAVLPILLLLLPRGVAQPVATSVDA